MQLCVSCLPYRGKQYGHDVDCLITHPVEGQEDGLLPKVISSLNRQGLVLYHSINENTYSERQDLEHLSSKTTSFDHFERCFSIFKLYTQMVSGEGPIKLPLLSNLKTIEHCASDVPEEEFSGIEAEQLQKWKAVRVDLVVVPFSQYAYALLGWTGSKCFERELRRYASHEKNMILNSHALYDKQQKMFLPAESEEEIFAHLGLEYISPTDRNA
ncbi:DNA nucleotidylexotransferase-like [Protopterus annectens]|uniref:DNA nucleotidylexotransferase-like n=1 Tax=Protopterus annectens TaxID=7888 RepID=UPI001CFAC90D|nr:DNA nucleotidylexotransferase-like [Protopterus annectens]